MVTALDAEVNVHSTVRKSWRLAAAVAAFALVAAGCGGDSEEETAVGQDAAYWEQLTSVMQPLENGALSDHRVVTLPNGVLFALHFDNMDLDQAENVNWVAFGLPGRFCKEDQERVAEQLGDGVTHFHDLENDAHGGEPGTEGVWLVHVGARDFEAEWGEVTRGEVDQNFMPTEGPDCG